MDFANPGLIEIARTGSPEQRMALFQTALCVWGHFVDMSFGEQRTDESLGEAIKVSSAIYMRVPGTEVPGKLANLPELSADKNIYADKLEAAIGKISSEVRREEAVEFAALISGRVRYVESLVQKA